MTYRMPRAMYNSIMLGTKENPHKPLGFKEILAEVNRMVHPIVPITSISFM